MPSSSTQRQAVERSATHKTERQDYCGIHAVNGSPSIHPAGKAREIRIRIERLISFHGVWVGMGHGVRPARQKNPSKRHCFSVSVEKGRLWGGDRYRARGRTTRGRGGCLFRLVFNRLRYN